MRALAGIAAALTAAAAAAAQDAPERIDYLTFASGAVPIAIEAEGPALGASFEHAVRIIDGSPSGFSIGKFGTASTVVEFVYELPALTTFDRFAVPQVLETPSPSATFFREVTVLGSAEGPDAGYAELARAVLETHKTKGEVTELAVVTQVPVRWVRLRLQGGIQMPQDKAFLEFSELIGNGVQDPAPFSEAFGGSWKKGANEMVTVQQGAVVSGCYDRTGELTGTVGGNILTATGRDLSDGTLSAFLLSVAPDGGLRGVRSSNGGPFRLSGVPPAGGAKTGCAAPPVEIGCGAILHGIGFDYDSAVLRPEAEGVLAALHAGLAGDPAARIVIEGHTSSEGSDAYNQELSERRAQAVVAALVAQGLAAGRLSALGMGEARPIASNEDENGRAVNRRVEVVCH